jgi:hypothetical protein
VVWCGIECRRAGLGWRGLGLVRAVTWSTKSSEGSLLYRTACSMALLKADTT